MANSKEEKEIPNVGELDGEEDEENKFALKRTIGLWGGVSFYVGVMIGSGIFVSPKSVLEASHSVGLSLTVWALCGVISIAGALSYAEISLLVKKSGGSYSWFLAVFPPEIAFMQMFLVVFLTGPSSMAAMALACSEYILSIFFTDGCSGVPQTTAIMLATLVMLVVALINILSVKYAINTQIIFTVAKLFALFIICLGGIVRLGQGYTEHLQDGYEGSNTNIAEITLAFYGGMWAYDGWAMLQLFVEEVKDPNRNVPLGAVISITLVTGVYMLANVSYFTVMSPQELLDSPAVASTWAAEVIPNFAWIMPVFVAMSTFGSTNGSAFNGFRSTYIPAREGHMVSVLAMVHVTRYTPAAAVIFNTILGIIFLLLGGNVYTLINWFSFAAWLIHGVVMFEVIYMRFAAEWKDKHRPFKVPLICPIFVLIVAVYFVVGPIVAEPDWGYLFAIILLPTSLVLFYPFVKRKWKLPGTDAVTKNLQMLLQVAPEGWDVDVGSITQSNQVSQQTQTVPDAYSAPYTHNANGVVERKGAKLESTAL